MLIDGQTRSIRIETIAGEPPLDAPVGRISPSKADLPSWFGKRSSPSMSRISRSKTRFRPDIMNVAGLTQTFHTLGSDMTHATQMAQQMLYGAMQRQAAMLGYIGAIYIFALIAAVMAPAAFLMQKPAKGVKARSGH